jgi:tetratricopeptide (TPR) repeat protein
MDDYDRAEVALSYRWVAQYTSSFLNAYLKHDPDALTYLKRTPAENGVQKHLMSLDFRPATGLAPTLESFRAEVGRRGFRRATEVFAEARTDDPDYKISEKAMILWGINGLLEQGHLSEAVEVLKLAVTMYPSSSNVYSSLGEAYRRTGNKTLAVENFRKAFELDHFNYFAEDSSNDCRMSQVPCGERLARRRDSNIAAIIRSKPRIGEVRQRLANPLTTCDFNSHFNPQIPRINPQPCPLRP